MNWKDHISVDEGVLAGKPVIKGTRISLEFIIERLADGWTQKDLLENHPRLSPTDLQAVFAYIKDCLRDGLIINYPPKSA